jgi:hypothetical protein
MPMPNWSIETIVSFRLCKKTGAGTRSGTCIVLGHGTTLLAGGPTDHCCKHVWSQPGSGFIVAGASSRSTLDPLAYGQHAAAGSRLEAPATKRRAETYANMFTAVVCPTPPPISAEPHRVPKPFDERGRKIRIERRFKSAPFLSQDLEQIAVLIRP